MRGQLLDATTNWLAGAPALARRLDSRSNATRYWALASFTFRRWHST
jgi:hypothetical protein